MNFNRQYDSHKIVGWEEFYIEYKELKDYINEAKTVLKNRTSSRKKSTDSKDTTCDHNGIPEIINENDLNNIQNFEKFKVCFKQSLQKAEKFYRKLKEDLMYDFKIMKELVDELIDKEVMILILGII